MLLKFKGVDKFGNLQFTANDGQCPISYFDLVKKSQKRTKMCLNTYNPIYISAPYKFCCITFKKNYNQLDTPVVGGIFEIKFNLTRHEHKGKDYITAVIISLELVEEPSSVEVLDF